MADTGIVCAMATTNLFSLPVFKDGAFTSNDAQVRAFAIQKTMNAIDLGVELGAKIYVFWGGRERHLEVDASKCPMEAIQRNREAMNCMTSYVKDRRLRSSSSRSKPSRTNRAATSTMPRPATCSPLSKRSNTKKWSASIRSTRTRRWPG